MFTQEQLEAVYYCAKKMKNQGELAVAKFLDKDPIGANFDKQQRNIVQYCAEECKRQRSGEMSVYDMVNAWHFMQVEVRDCYPETQLTNEIISHVGTLVEPHDNAKGFRTIPIGVQDGYFWHEKAQWAEVPRLLEHLLNSYYNGNFGFHMFDHDSRYGVHELSERGEDQFYYEYENIHPFVDGNGRSGKILYNYLCGTLDSPIMPPNFWGGSNP